ncbi:MAG: bifunctional DNA primase/polymerase [Labilithrix sp.]|nr:bifunctional DNA primase/polymerase [Labilithrix sp.]
MTRSTALLIVEARRLWDAGLVPIPLCRPTEKPGHCSAAWHGVPCNRIGKTPLVRGYPQFAVTRPVFDELLDHMRRCAPCNVGVVTGKIVVVEADSLEAESEVIALGGNALDETPTRERRPGRGRAWLFLAGDDEVSNGSHRGESGAIDVRGMGGILVSPPSVHATGHTYAWLPGLAPWEVAPIGLPPALRSIVMSSAKTNRPARVAVTVRRAMPSRVALMVRSRPRIRSLWNGVGKEVGDTSASGYDFAFVRELLFNGVSVADAAAALAHRPGAHRQDDAYVTNTVDKAHAALATRRSR